MTNAELLRAVEAWALANYHLHAVSVSIRLQALAEPVVLPVFVPPGMAAENGAGGVDERGGRGLSPCILDILKVMREVKKPLSRTRLMEEMSRRGMDWADRTVAGYLARLVEDGTLENAGPGKGGYRLPADDMPE